MNNPPNATTVLAAPTQPHPLVEFWNYFRDNRGALTRLIVIVGIITAAFLAESS